MKFDIDVSGVEKVKSRLGSGAAERLVDAIELDIRNEVNKTVVEAYETSPVDTGALRTSILSSPRRVGTMTFYWGSRLPYALRQEYEHKKKKGWMDRAYRRGNKRTLKALKATIQKRLKG